jgi:hypothetical protein
MTEKILAVGLDPAFADTAAFPQFTPEMLRSHIDAQLDRVRDAGYVVVSCLVDRGETAEAVVASALTSDRFDCVVIGAGCSAATALGSVSRRATAIELQFFAIAACERRDGGRVRDDHVGDPVPPV